MTAALADIFANTTLYLLSGLAGLTLFFLLVAIRELRDECAEGYLYLTIALFLAVGHAVLLENVLTCEPPVLSFADLNLWGWLAAVLAPALIALFVIRSLVNFVFAQSREGILKLFFGATLLCCLYLIGTNWPVDIKGILTIIWVGFLFKTEIAITS